MSGEPYPRFPFQPHPFQPYPETYGGMRIIVSETCLKDVPNKIKPSRHRSKRILKKLMKQTHREPAIFNINGSLIMHPVHYEELKRKFRENGNLI